MTTLRHPPIDQFVTRLKARFDLTTLVETGTFEGESTLYAAERFVRVVTIDVRDDYQAYAQARCAGHTNIEFRLGDTRIVLIDVLMSLHRPALFWLDAHAAPGLFGDKDDWPTLEEVGMITQSPQRHFILIDDAHCFLPQSPHPVCPTFEEIQAVATKGGYVCRISHDVIAMVHASKFQILDYFYEETT